MSGLPRDELPWYATAQMGQWLSPPWITCAACTKVMGDRETQGLIDCRQTELQSKKLGFSK